MANILYPRFDIIRETSPASGTTLAEKLAALKKTWYVRDNNVNKIVAGPYFSFSDAQYGIIFLNNDILNGYGV